jgi:hypothetical protein
MWRNCLRGRETCTVIKCCSHEGCSGSGSRISQLHSQLVPWSDETGRIYMLAVSSWLSACVHGWICHCTSGTAASMPPRCGSRSACMLQPLLLAVPCVFAGQQHMPGSACGADLMCTREKGGAVALNVTQACMQGE